MTETLKAPMEPRAGLQRKPRSQSPDSSRPARGLWWRRAATLPALALLLAVAMVLAGAVGEVPIPPSHDRRDPAESDPDSALACLSFPAELAHRRRGDPPAAASAAGGGRGPGGGGLAVPGTLFQGLLRNPLADPLLLGTSSGAALGASIAFVVPALFTADWLGFGLIPALAFAGALLAVALVYSLASSGGHTPVVTLLLAGVAVSAVLTALQTLIITRNDRLGLQISSLYLWLAGGVDVRDLAAGGGHTRSSYSWAVWPPPCIWRRFWMPLRWGRRWPPI